MSYGYAVAFVIFYCLFAPEAAGKKAARITIAFRRVLAGLPARAGKGMPSHHIPRI